MIRPTPTNIAEQLDLDEARRATVYPDSRGYMTVGVGINLEDPGLYPEEIDFLRDNRIRRNNDALRALYPWMFQLDLARLGVFQNMCYNMGILRFSGFKKMIAAAEARDWPTVQKEMQASEWYPQVKDRAKRLCQQIITGQWQ